MKTFNAAGKFICGRIILCLLALLSLGLKPGLGMAQTDPATFTSIMEQPKHGSAKTITATNTEVDDQSIIQINFDRDKMAPPQALVPGGSARPRVHLRVEVYSTKGTSRSPVAPVPHYVDLLPAPAASTTTPNNAGGAAPESTSSGTVVYHDKYYNPSIGAAAIPNTEINLGGTQAGDADFIEIRVTNLETQESLIMTVMPQKFGFRVKVSDSLMFIKRLGVGKQDQTAGVDAVNFSPSPGVTYGGTYFSRGNRFARFFQPGVGINLLFTKWGDAAFDISTGQFVQGTKAGDIQTGLGGQFSLFGDVLQFTYGADLQVQQKRQYFGIGVSFVSLSAKISGLIAK
jgi:hypothetical protein